MDPTLTAALELERAVEVGGGGSGTDGNAKSTGSKLGKGKSEDPNSFENQRRRVLNAALAATPAAEAMSNATSSVLDLVGGRDPIVSNDSVGNYEDNKNNSTTSVNGEIEVDEDGDAYEGFEMPSMIPEYARGGSSTLSSFVERSEGRGGARKRGAGVGGGASFATLAVAAKAFEAHQRALAKGVAVHKSAIPIVSTAATRKREREEFLADYNSSVLSENILRCTRCRRGLGVSDGGLGEPSNCPPQILNDAHIEDLVAVYMHKAREFVSNSPLFSTLSGASVTAVGSSPSLPQPQEAPRPRLWCPSCVLFVSSVVTCPLCPPRSSNDTNAGGGMRKSNTNREEESPFDLSAYELFKDRFGSGNVFFGGSSSLRGDKASASHAYPQPIITCLRCRRGFHGSCLGMSEDLAIALASLSEHNRYCCPECSLESAVLVEPKTNKK